ncbi:TIGR02680 family protein [Nonomuraea sediminis]|uniref:TIGR02680 family protein n=1 Tax=Nonomuraea sediminis TaxID=2835864 RepID=UPI001BDCFBC2|nr:TIGR02680 family protein [Nonomuraea sediminis]
MTAGSIDQTAPKHHPDRLRLNRAGIVNVWYYYNTEFAMTGGRLVLRGTNGSGKSRALEMLLPFLLDADRRRMDATGSGRVRLEELMRSGGEDQPNRLGYLWLELVRHAPEPEHLTLGALIRFAHSTGEAKVWYFTTPLRVGHELILLGDDRTPLSREGLAEVIGADRMTTSPEVHRDRVRGTVFGLAGETGGDRFGGLLQLLRTLRAPDMGNRIDEGKLPQILSDALPPLGETAILQAGEKLDGLTETRAAQQRLAAAHRQVADFLAVYRRYAAGVLRAAAGDARDAAHANSQAAQDEVKARQDLDDLVTQQGNLKRKLEELDDLASELSNTIIGIRESKEYAAVRDLDDREKKLDALGRAAGSAIGLAAHTRDAETGKATDADRRGDEVVAAARTASRVLTEARAILLAAGIHPTLPDAISAEPVQQPAVVDVVRTDLLRDPESVVRPAPCRIVVAPSDLETAVTQVTRVEKAAKEYAAHAETRRQQARVVDRKRAEVNSADKAAEDAGQLAEDERSAMAAAQAERDEAALALARSWRTWVASGSTRSLLPDVDWAGTAAGPLLADVAALLGEDALVLLPELDEAAREAALTAQNRFARLLSELEAAEGIDREKRDKLAAEADGLRDQRDPDPPAPPWVRQGHAGRPPLWQMIDFAPHLDAVQRAGLESAMLASGLLTATLASDGGLAVQEGDLLVSPVGPVAETPLGAVLVPDTASVTTAQRISAVLARIAFGAGDHPIWVDAQGNWRNGPLSGRHVAPAARHIGAAARAAARAARLAEIEQLLAELEQTSTAREAERGRLRDDQEALNLHLRRAPRSQPLQTSHALVVEAAKRVATAEENHRRLAASARELRDAWTTMLRAHRSACQNFGLPHEAEALEAVQKRAEEGAGACDRAAERLRELRERIARHDAVVAECEGKREGRREAENAADSAWRDWHLEAAELAAIRDHLGASAERIRAELEAAEREYNQCDRQQKGLRRAVSQIDEKKGAASAQVASAQDKALSTRVTLTQAAGRLTTTLRLPGVFDAVTDTPPSAADPREIDSSTVLAFADAVIAAVGPAGAPVDETTLVRAQQVLERELAGGFDVIPSVQDGVRLLAIADGAGQHTLRQAADDLRRRHEEGQIALSEHEHLVFTEFVLGGVAEELRNRLTQANDLIKAMNASLAGIRTSHGIGVRLRWNLVDTAGADIARIRTLVATAGEVRTPEQSAELIELMNARVNQEFTTDETAGYAAHLKAALDYRAWHEVEVVITGPEPGRERRISRRAKLSQGETRFVSYVTLFAAADAYLSSLPDTARALRLILLDDAFAKVDEQTIAELMGLLVKLDLDFVMTGHALWGCYPQVPRLDCYEIMRGDGTAAGAAHTHWDGRNRHLRAAT